jgi:hypothetical protein
MIIKISTDFTESPGARNITDGPFSGEEFRDKILRPKFEEAIKNKEKLTINFDGGFGYPTSFLEESFGGLARIYDEDLVLKSLEFISNDEPSLIEEVKSYIRFARRDK